MTYIESNDFRLKFVLLASVKFCKNVLPRFRAIWKPFKGKKPSGLKLWTIVLSKKKTIIYYVKIIDNNYLY